MRKRATTFVVLCLLLVSSTAAGQLQQLVGGAKDEPGLEVQISTGQPHAIAEREKKVLLERQQALLAAASELENARDEMKTAQDRAAEVRGLAERLREKVALEREAVRLWEEREIERAEKLEAFRSAEASRMEALAAEPVEPLDADAAPPQPLEPPVELTTPEPRPGVTHPSYVEQFDWLAALLERKAARLDRLVIATVEQREMVGGAIQLADRVLERHARALERRAAAADVDAERPSLSVVRGMLYDLHLARLELALARSHERAVQGEQGGGTIDAPLEDDLRAPQIADLPSEAGRRMRETFEETLRVRDEAQEVRVDLARVEARIRLREESGRDLRQRALRLDVIAKQQRVDDLAEQFEAALGELQVTPEELTARRARHDKWSPLIEAEIARTESDLATLRSSPEAAGGMGREHYTEGHVWELNVTALQEELNFHLLRRERLHFTTEAFDVLAAMLDGKAPSQEFLRRHKRLLDRDALGQRLDDIGRRHEAWRRQHAQFLRSDVETESEGRRREVLEATQRIANLCSDQEAILESDGRLATIVRHFLELHERASRGLWWYALRILATLAVLVAAGIASVLVGKLTLRLSRVAMAHGQLPTRFSGGQLDIRGVYRGTKRSLVFGLYLIGLLAVWLGALLVVFQVTWGVELGLGRLGDALSTPLFLVGETQVTPGSFVKLFIALALAFAVARLTQAFLRGQVFRFFEWDEGVRHAVSAILRYVVLFIGIALGLEYVGIGLSTFAVLLGVVGIGIGFGLQHIANNFISGFVILFERPVKKGDFVAAGDLEGEVLDVNARATTVQTRDNISVIIPNSEFISGRVINWSHNDPRIRLRIPVGVAYGSDVPKVEEVLLAVARSNPQVLEYPNPDVWFTSFGDSSLNFELLAWTRNIRDRFAIASDLNKAIDRSFREAGITIPFPQRDVHIKSDKPRADSGV